MKCSDLGSKTSSQNRKRKQKPSQKESANELRSAFVFSTEFSYLLRWESWRWSVSR